MTSTRRQALRRDRHRRRRQRPDLRGHAGEERRAHAALEQRARVGGCAAEGEIAPGFTVPTLAHATGPVRARRGRRAAARISTASSFTRHGDHVSALSPDGRALVLWNDARADGGRLARVVGEGRGAHGRRSSNRCSALGALIGSLFIDTPPSVDAPTARDVLALLRTLRAFRSLPKADQWRLLRWGPMAVADLVGESIETELLRAAVAADGIFGAMLGPWSAGSGLQLLLAAANDRWRAPAAAWSSGGPVALARALESAAVAIRRGDPNRRAASTRIDVTDDRATA